MALKPGLCRPVGRSGPGLGGGVEGVAEDGAEGAWEKQLRLWFFQSFVWHFREQYSAPWHFAQRLRVLVNSAWSL